MRWSSLGHFIGLSLIACSLAATAGGGLESRAATRPGRAVKAPDAAARIDAFVREQVVKGRFSGTVLVAVGRKVILERSYGWANREQHRANTPTSPFRVNWYVRRFLGVALLRLEERGRVSLAAPACRFIDACRQDDRSVTLRDVLEYRATLNVSPPPRRTNLKGWIEWARRHSSLGSASEPESAISDDLLLAAAIEQASQKSWLRYLRTNVFAPARMSATRIGSSGLKTHGYIGRRDGTFALVRPTHRRVQPDVYGLVTTAGDLWRFDQALWGGKLVHRRSLARLLRRPYGWKYGWLVGREDGLLSASGTAHGDRGWYAFATRYPSKRLSVILLANEGAAKTLDAPGAVLGDLESGITSIVLGRPCHMPPHPVSVDSAVLAGYAGFYKGKRIYGPGAINPPPPELDLTASVIDGRLDVQWNKKQNARFGNFFSSGTLIPLSPTAFASEHDSDLRFAFSYEGDTLKLLVTHVCYRGLITRLVRVR
jgi:CubicO group peptidase (beta-lactamase class C family)